MAEQPSELALHLKRDPPVPPPVLFKACTEPMTLAKWWGPRGFTTPNIEIDLRVGGRCRCAMPSPGGASFHLLGEFREIDPPSRLAYTFLWEPQTRMIWRRSSSCHFGTPMDRRSWASRTEVCLPPRRGGRCSKVGQKILERLCDVVEAEAQSNGH